MKVISGLCLLAPILACAQTADVLNPDVRPETIATTICVSGYTKSVRPATSYTNGVKRKLMREQGIDPARAREFELDHIVPLEIGGHPRNIHNLMLQPCEGEGGAREKDKLETKLKRMVCAGRMPLRQAQACIWKDWKSCAAKVAK